MENMFNSGDFVMNPDLYTSKLMRMRRNRCDCASKVWWAL